MERKNEEDRYAHDLQQTEHQHGPPSLTIDLEKYLPYLEDEEISEEDKREFLQVLWNIIVEFVSLGFGVHPLQQLKNNCGQFEESARAPTSKSLDAVKSSDGSIIEQFIEATDLDAEAGAESGAS